MARSNFDQSISSLLSILSASSCPFARRRAPPRRCATCNGRIAFDHSGSSFDDFLEEEGIREEVEAVAIKRVLAWQLSQEMHQQKKTKQAMAWDLHTSRSQLDRLLDPWNVSVSLETMARAARVLGKSLVIRIGDRKVRGAKRRGEAGRAGDSFGLLNPETPETQSLGVE